PKTVSPKSLPVLTVSPRRAVPTAAAMVALLQMSKKVMKPTRFTLKTCSGVGQAWLEARRKPYPPKSPVKVRVSESRKSHIITFPQLASKAGEGASHLTCAGAGCTPRHLLDARPASGRDLNGPVQHRGHQQEGQVDEGVAEEPGPPEFGPRRPLPGRPDGGGHVDPAQGQGDDQVGRSRNPQRGEEGGEDGQDEAVDDDLVQGGLLPVDHDDHGEAGPAVVVGHLQAQREEVQGLPDHHDPEEDPGGPGEAAGG